MLTKIYTTRPTTTYDFDNAGGVIVMVRSVIRSVCLSECEEDNSQTC